MAQLRRLLLGNSVRLCGKFNIWKNAAGTALPGAADNLSMDERTGIYSCIDQVVIKSQATHQVIEHIRHYNRMMSSYLPTTTSLQDGMGHMSETSLIMPNYSAMKGSVVNIPSGETTKNSFCIHLPCGLFNGTQGIPLSGAGGVGGLLLEVHLAPDANVLFDTTALSAAGNLTDSYYELSDVFLACEAVEDVRPPGSSSTFEYNSISSYFASVNSTNAIINFNLGLSRVLGVFMNFIPSAMINNLDYNGMTTMPLQNKNAHRADLTQIIYTRGGQKYPFMFNIDLAQKEDSTIQQYDPVFVRGGIDAIKNFANSTRMTISPNNSKLTNFTGSAISSPAGNGTSSDIGFAEGGNCFTLGCGFDSISNQGISFATESFGVNLTTKLTSDNPHGVFMFAHAKNTLVFGQGGVQVLN